MDKSVLIAMPCFNHQGEVTEAIQYITNQTYKNFKLVVCNDASTDDSLAVLQELQKQHSFELLTNQFNLGTGRTINKIFTETLCKPGAIKYDYLTWISSDNWCEPSFLQRHVDNLNSGVAFSFSAWKRGAKSVANCNHDSKKTKIAYGLGPSFMFARKLWLLAGPYHSFPGEDWVFGQKCHLVGAKFGYIKESLVIYREHSNCVSGRIRRGDIKDLAVHDAHDISNSFDFDITGEKSFQ